MPRVFDPSIFQSDFHTETQNASACCLISWYKFECDLTDAHRQHDGTMTGCELYACGKKGDALCLNDISYDVVSNSSDFQFCKCCAFSVSYWFKTPMCSPQTGATITKSLNNAGTTIGWRSFINTAGRIIWEMSDGTTEFFSQSDACYDDGCWHHVVVGYDGSNNGLGLSIYIDGMCNTNSTSCLTMAGTMNSCDSVTIGAGSAGANTYTGQIDEVSVWNKALNFCEITHLYNCGNGLTYEQLDKPTRTITNACLVSWHRLDCTLNDSHSCNNGAMTGGCPSYSCAVFNNGISLTGAETIRISPECPYDFDIACPFSISAWVRPMCVGAAQNIFSKGGTFSFSDGYYFLRRASGELRVNLNTSTGANSNNYGTVLNCCEWYHLVMTYDGSSNKGGARVFINSVDEGGPAVMCLSGTLLTNTAPSIGSTCNATNRWIGCIDEVSVWSKQLSQCEIDQLYNEGHGITYQDLIRSTPTITKDCLISYYDFNCNIDDVVGNDDAEILAGAEAYTCGIRGKSFDFCGDTVAVLCASSVNFENTNPFSISLWVMCAGVNDDFIRHYGNGLCCTNRGWRFFNTSTAGIEFDVSSDAANWIRVRNTHLPVGAIDDGQWHHIVATYDGSLSAFNTMIYVDTIECSVVINNNLVCTIKHCGPLYLGGIPTLAGQLDEVSIWGKELSTCEILDLYNGGTGLPLSSFSGTIVGLGTSINAFVLKRGDTGDVYLRGDTARIYKRGDIARII